MQALGVEGAALAVLRPTTTGACPRESVKCAGCSLTVPKGHVYPFVALYESVDDEKTEETR